MKIANSLLIISFICLFVANLHSQTILVSGTINSNTTWSADTVKIMGDVSVMPGVSLFISQGTYIEAQGYFKMEIHGEIKAIGTQNELITFTVKDTSNFWEDTLSSQGGWGGITILGANAVTDTSIFEFCSFNFGKKYDTYAGNIKGGAVNVKDYGTLIIKNSFFRNNMVICYIDGVDGAAGGAVFCRNVNSVLISGNRFDHNRSFDSGGAIDIHNNCTGVIIRNNLFLGNISLSLKYAGGMWLLNGDGGAISIHDNIGLSPKIYNNQCFNNTSVNGVIYTSCLNATVYNNVICNNFSDAFTDGHQLSTSRIFNNTVVNNLIYQGAFQLFSSANVYNNIVWGNINGYTGQLSDQINVTTILPVHPILFNNCVNFGNGGTNAVYTDPKFVNPSQGVGTLYDGSDADWSVLLQSPCINTGTPDTAGLLIPFADILGNNRIYPSRIDIGAYENNSLWLNDDDNIISSNAIAYPNPGTNFFTIQSGPSINGAQFTLYDMQGRSVLAEKMLGTQVRVNTSGLSTGTYPWQIVYKNKVVESGKWVKE